MSNNRRIYRSAMGKVVDIDSLRIANEENIAVGNMKVNARGDELGPGGVILKKRSEIEASRNALPSGRVNAPMQTDTNRAVSARGNASTVSKPTGRKAPITVDPVQEAKAQEYQPIEFPDDVDDQEPFKEEELAEVNTPPTKSSMRGSLAASVASSKTVEQKLETDPRKPKGPRRI